MVRPFRSICKASMLGGMMLGGVILGGVILGGGAALAQGVDPAPTDPAYQPVAQDAATAPNIPLAGYDWYKATARKPYSISYSPQGDIWRFEVRPGENEARSPADIAGAQSKDRSELWMLGNTEHSFRAGVCLAFRMNVEDMPQEAGRWTVLGQWHAVEDPGDAHLSPVFAQEFNSDGLRIVIRSDFAEKQELPNKNPTVVYADHAYPTHRWVNWQYQIVFSQDRPDGEITAWRDGVTVAHVSGVGLGYNDRIRPRYQFGIYRGYDYTGRAVVLYSGIHVREGGCAAPAR